jgi:hypothetical protein
LIFMLSAAVASHADPPVVVYEPNLLFTTDFGPATADILLTPPNFLRCHGGPIALCYYSGPEPEGAAPDLSCEITSDPTVANCRCVEIPPGHYYVDINAIQDVGVYLATVRKCGRDGSKCSQSNEAPVCKSINQGRFLADAAPDWDTISTFSLALDSTDGYKIEGKTCDAAPYAGCMTAPCVRNGETVKLCDDCAEMPVDVCACSIFDGKFQIGKEGASCDIGNNPWSAAYNPLTGRTSPGCCIPDAPGDIGCPLLPPVSDSPPLRPLTPTPPASISCGKVCAEYGKTRQSNGVEVGFTCDATLCTASAKDLFLANDACTGIEQSPLSEIFLLEQEAGCSCCASQICGCEPSPKTNAKIYELDEAQRALGIKPQCDINGSLCGGL